MLKCQTGGLKGTLGKSMHSGRYGYFSPTSWNTCIAVLAGLALTACNSSGSDIRRGLPDPGSSSTVERVLSPDPSGEVIGNGPVRVSLLVPSSIPGGAAAVAKELRNGAAMAMGDSGAGKLQLVVKDTKGLAAEAQNRAGEAVAEGSSLILGPLFAANVSAASGVTIPANIPILAFSTDTTVARRGSYLFSYTPQADTKRMINYAASIQRRSIAAFLPKNAEGTLRSRLIKEIAGGRGMSAQIFEYERTPKGIEAILVQAAAQTQNADSIYVPEGGPLPGLIIGGLKRNGVDLASKQIFGSGAWESVKTSDPVLNGALYPGRDISKFGGFAQRYEQKFGVRPGVQAAIAYDAVTLAAELVRQGGPKTRFSSSNFESPRGFQGTTGAFRILSNGTTQRGLAIYQIRSGKGVLLEQAVSSFSGRGS